MNLYTP